MHMGGLMSTWPDAISREYASMVAKNALPWPIEALSEAVHEELRRRALLERDQAYYLVYKSKSASMMLALALRGIRMRVGGCGCCGSPRVSFEVDGDMLFFEEQQANFDMFEDDE